MLIRRVVLDRIAAGEIDTLFRRQKRPTVKTGGTLRTSIGMLEIVSVEEIELGDITTRDARRAGFGTAESLVAELTGKPDGRFYRARIRLAGPDPRLALRDDADLADEELAEVVQRLDRLDRASGRGRWTEDFLSVIDRRPNVRAPDLAAELGWDTPPFKANVRKLKALGLTISHSPGYELSPRGRAVWERLSRPG